MRLTLSDEYGNIHVVEVSDDMTTNDLKALAEVEFRIPSGAMRILHNGVELSPSATLKTSGVVQDDICLVAGQAGQAGLTGSHGSQASDQSEQIRQQLLADPALLRRVAAQTPALAAAVANASEFRRVLMEINRLQKEADDRRRQDELYLANADPFDLDAQKKIEEQIKKENIHKNLEIAMELHPEAFGRVIMLYIDMEVNGVPVKAFVDSGAQATIMSPDCADKCKIMHLLDERFAGIAEGVGTAKILGRVHSAQIKLGSQHLACSFTIMEGKGVDLLFGLDQLKRYQACIDLAKNCLQINGEEIRFLDEHELPEQAKEKIRPTQQQQQPQASSSSSSARAASSSDANFTETDINTLVEMGVTRDIAIRALKAAGGNVDIAAGMLF